MNNRILILLAFMATTFSFSSCVKLHEDENHHYKIYFENSWDKPVFVLDHIDWHWYDNPDDQYVAPFYEKQIPEEAWNHKIQPGDIDDELMEYNRYYETALKDKDSVVISVYNAEHLEMTISECFLVRYHLSKEDLRKINFHVSFPPTEAMKTFYMKPSFDELNELLMKEQSGDITNHG